jgi:hypothetical protein
MRGRVVVRGLRIVLALVVVGTLVDLAPTHAQAQDGGGTLAGYQGRAAASGLHALYNPAGILPVPPPVDLNAPDALATISSGPATFARAAVADPGDLLASPDALLAQASADYPAGTIPNWPLRISVASGVGVPAAQSDPAPGLHARVEAGDGSSSALAETPKVDLPAVVTVGSMSASATTETDGTKVTVHARSHVGNVSLLGLVTIGSVVTDLTATSDGTKTELTGGTKVTNASLMGTPITIDADGIHAADQPPLLGGVVGPLVASLNDLLKQAGIQISVATPVEITGGSTDELSSYGLRIGFELSPQTFPALAALIDALPPLENPVPGAPSAEDLLALAKARHLVAVEVGRGQVSLLARTSAALGGGDTPISGDIGGIDVPSTSPPFSLPGDTGTVAPPAVDLGGTPAETAALPKGAGVGAAVLLALLAIPFVGDRIARICSAVLATDATTTCTWEEPR